jgi:hypothetical protein
MISSDGLRLQRIRETIDDRFAELQDQIRGLAPASNCSSGTEQTATRSRRPNVVDQAIAVALRAGVKRPVIPGPSARGALNQQAWRLRPRYRRRWCGPCRWQVRHNPKRVSSGHVIRIGDLRSHTEHSRPALNECSRLADRRPESLAAAWSRTPGGAGTKRDC